MQINIRTGVPLPAHQLAAKAKPEYTAMAEQMKAMAVGDSFEVAAKEAVTIRYIAKTHNITLASRTLGDKVGFWKKEYEAPKPRKPRTPKADTAAAAVTEGAATEADGGNLEVEVSVD